MSRVWYITMAFPVPSEAFASVEILELKNQGVDVKVKTLRFRRHDHNAVTEQQSTDDVEVSHSSGASVLRGAFRALQRPWLATRLVAKLVGSLWQRPTILVACLWWSLRCFDLLGDTRLQNPDVVHLYWGHAPAILGWLILETLPAQKLTTSLSAYDLELNLPISYEVARRCDGVRTWSPSNVKTIIVRGIPVDRIRVVYQGIKNVFFTDATASKIPGRIAVAARLIPEKGVAQAIEIVARLRQRFPEAHLVIYGDGPQRQTLDTLVERDERSPVVTFAGHVAQRLLAKELQRAEFFLLPSTHHAERLPNVIKEALAAGCYILTTPTPDIECLIVNKTVGAIFPASETESWVQTIANQMDRRSVDAHACRDTRRSVLVSFDIEATARELLAWWGMGGAIG
ncbi:MAG: glycosyltransferase [Planctomycetaceae bacterium]|nr:glycosyltransferase [Planctomycetaceae bacterium]